MILYRCTVLFGRVCIFMSKENKKHLSDEELEEIAGAGLKEQILAGSLGISALVSPMNAIEADAKAAPGTSFAPKTIASEKLESLPIVKYLTEARISKAQEKAFNVTNKIAKKNPDHRGISYTVSSDRYDPNTKKTSLEAALDEDVKNGDLPLPDFTLADMKKAKDNAVSKSNDKNVKFVLYPSLDAMLLHESEECRDGDIVNLASQFNALESVSNEPTAVAYWYLDKTQGPYCALQSVAATKHREAADLQNKLTDGLKEALDYCKIDGKPITEKYPNLYKGGYLEMMEIKEEKDMEAFLKFLEDEENLSKHMRVLMQWVKCEGTGKKQLQFFTAAPSFQGRGKSIWNKKSRITELRRKACVKLVELQYRAMAQAAAVRYAETGENVRLHVTMVGHGVFNNPKETVDAALKALNEELQGVDATVFLHNRPDKPNVWEEKGNLEQLGIDAMTLEDWKNKSE